MRGDFSTAVSGSEATVQGLRPVRREIAIDPIAARLEAVVARFEIQQQRDAPTLAIELAVVVIATGVNPMTRVWKPNGLWASSSKTSVMMCV